MVLFFAAALVVTWCVAHVPTLAAGEYGSAGRFVLGALFSLLILLRRKHGHGPGEESSRPRLAIAGIGGMALAIAGIVFSVRQFEWIGLLLVLFACLRWSLPPRFAGDISISVLLFYFVHPLPDRVAGSLQFAMQGLSVRGAEALLHAFNQRVWADGMVLRSPTRVFEVPEACSGMATALTVLMCAAGIGLLFRFAWRDILGLALAGLAQTAVLNTVRIALVAGIAGAMDRGWAEGFLHDTAGTLLLAGVVLVYLEAYWWKRRQSRRAAALEEPDTVGDSFDYSRSLPAFWGVLFRWRARIPALALAGVLLIFVLFKSTPYHRARMIGDVAAELAAVDTALSERAGRAALGLDENNEDARRCLIRVLLLRGKFKAALTELDAVPLALRDIQHIVLKAWGLMGLGRRDETARLLNVLTDDERRMPGIAMVEAELAARRDDPDAVARMAARAAEWDWMLPRIRALFPYMASRGLWETIVKSDMNVPYSELPQALISAHAHLKLNDTPGAARALRLAMKKWPDDPNLLRYLYAMAAVFPSSRWEDLFAAKLMTNLRALDADDLAMCAELCFQLRRPDLGWLTYLRLKSVDPRHPAVLMLPAVFGDIWFEFRKRRLGLASGLDQDTATMTSSMMHYVMRFASPWQRAWEEIPLMKELTEGNVASRRVEYLRKALDEFRARDADNRLSKTMEYRYVAALEMAGQDEAAQARRGTIGEEHPEERERVTLMQADAYGRMGDWDRAYELLRPHRERKRPALHALLMLCSAEANLRLGLCALDTADRMVRLYPGSERAAALRVQVVNAYRGPEEALFELSRPAGRLLQGVNRLESEALLQTQRFVEEERARGVLLLPSGNDPGKETQKWSLPPAETSLQWHRARIPSESEFAAHAQGLEKNRAGMKSPFLRGLASLWLDCYKGACEGGLADPDRWSALGRDRVEQAAALNQLTLLLCRQGRFSQARDVARRAVDLHPECGPLWHMLVGLEDGDYGVVSRARAACAADPEIWLAYLVSRGAREDAAVWAAQDVAAAVEGKSFSAATMVRAGDFLLRKGAVDAAAMAARDAEQRARGLLPAYVLSVRCALALKDVRWAQSATSKAIEFSVTPDPALFLKLVELKGQTGTADADMVDALKRLGNLDGGNPGWAELLGYVRFARGDTELVQTLDQMRAVIGGGTTNKRVYVIAAEAARRLGNPAEAQELLKRALAVYPDDVQLLNNLVYTMATDHASESEAARLVPWLLRIGAANEHVLDTVAVAYLRSGRLSEAEEVLRRAGDVPSEGLPMWFRMQLHAVEALMLRGDSDLANGMILDLMERTKGTISDEDLHEASRLMRDIEADLFERRRDKAPMPPRAKGIQTVGSARSAPESL